MALILSLISDHILTLLVTTVTFVLWWVSQRRRKQPAPGPWAWPLVGHLFLLMRGDKRELFRKLRAQYGDLVGLSVGRQSILVVSGSNMLREVFVKLGKHFDKRPQVFTVQKFGQGKDAQLLKFVGDLFTAGTETSATTLRWMLIFLVHHEDVQQTMYREIEKTLDGRAQLSILDKKKMPYTEAVILEGQRLGDIAPFSLPHATTEPVKVGDYVVPSGTLVIPNLNSVHLDPELWENPNEFKPSRFLNGAGEVVRDTEILPFFQGPRMCPGRGLARLELFLFLTSIVQHFQLLPSESEGLPRLDGHVGITYVPFPHRIRFVKRTLKGE